jgi:hypothetical protein
MGAWTEIVDFTFTANETSRAFTGLNITKDDFIKIVFTNVNASTSNSDIRCFPNTTASVSGFDTNTNYHSQDLGGAGTAVGADRANINRLTRTENTNTGSSLTYFKISENGKANFFTNRFFRNDSNIQNRFNYTTSSNLTFNDPITSLTFTAEQTNGLGTGSRIQIYRLDAEKVADITTTANATQVDISSLSIGKDDEYLLISDHISNGAEMRYELFPNDLTTSTNYYSQQISGNGSSTGTGRENNATINFQSVSGSRVMTYNHIKLSNIGAYTVQNYQNRLYGTSGIVLTNRFISSTAENITSITKLNIRSGTNGIATGSRFILYKLK